MGELAWIELIGVLTSLVPPSLAPGRGPFWGPVLVSPPWGRVPLWALSLVSGFPLRGLGSNPVIILLLEFEESANALAANFWLKPYCD